MSKKVDGSVFNKYFNPVTPISHQKLQRSINGQKGETELSGVVPDRWRRSMTELYPNLVVRREEDSIWEESTEICQ